MNRARWVWPRACRVALAALFLVGCNEQDGRTGAGSRRAPSPASSAGDASKGPGVLVLTPVVPPPAPPASPPARPSRRPPAAIPPPPAPLPPGAPPSFAVPGTYSFDETGFNRVRGCFTSDQPPPSPSRFRVDPATGSRQHFERTQTDPLGMGAVTVADLEYRSDGIYLVYLRQVQTLLLQSLPAEFEPAPPVLAVPARPAQGQSWSFSLTSKDGKVRVDSQNRVEVPDEVVTLAGGRTARAQKITSSSKITGQSSQGALDLTRTTSAWYSSEFGFQVKEITDTKGRIGLCEIDSHLESVLR